MAAGTLKKRTVAGKTFTCSNRTYYHLLWTIFVLKVRFPKATLRIIQGCYNTTVKASAGTHDFDAALDVEIVGLGWWKAQRFLRNRGWAAYYRHTGTWASPDAWHIHMISLPPGLRANPTPEEIGKAYKAKGIKVGRFIDGGYTTKGYVDATSQVDDYYAHALALAGEHRAGSDHSYFPNNINNTVFRRSWWTNRVNR